MGGRDGAPARPENTSGPLGEVNASTGGIALALATVYVVWGSTYLAIRFAIETMPPFLMAGVRFMVAGALLYAWRRARGAPRPSRRQWLATGVVGALLLLAGNGGVVWAEQWVASGTAALLVATVPLWMVLLDWLRPGGRRPRAMVWVGVAIGLAGVALLASGGAESGGGAVSGDRYAAGVVVLMLASVAWAVGSLYSRGAALPPPLQATAMEMLTGGALLLLLGLLTGEAAALDLAQVSTRSWLGLLYLIVFGSLVGFTSYVWLLRAASPALVSTYAYVNPVVAVFLGWLLAGEALTPRVLAASAIILGGVALISMTRVRRRPGGPGGAPA